MTNSVSNSLAGSTLDHVEIWKRKPVLRTIYGDLHRRIADHCQPGLTVEVGGGVGNFKERFPEVVCMDIQPLPWMDVVADAHSMPFAGGSVANVVLVDTLHHLAAPLVFLREASRVLRPGGRIVMVEPALTPLSWVVYNFLHPEPVEMRANPLALDAIPDRRDPFDSNTAIPSLLFGPYREELTRRLPELRLLKVERFSLAAYVLSGGFRRWTLLPDFAAPLFLRIEDRIAGVLGPLMAFRLIAVMERL